MCAIFRTLSFLTYTLEGKNYYLLKDRNFVEHVSGSIQSNVTWIANRRGCNFIIHAPAGDGNGYAACDRSSVIPVGMELCRSRSLRIA